MQTLNKDILIYLALDMDIPTLFNYCLVNKRINNIVCENNTFWMNKLNNDYPNTVNKFPRESNFKYIYMSLMNKIKKYYRYVIDTDDVNVQTVSDYARRYGSLKNMKLKIFQTKRKDNINSFEVIGDFPSGTKLWITNGIGFLTREEAFIEFNNNNCLKYYVDDDFLNYRDEFLLEKGRRPEDVYGFNYDEAFIYYRKQLEDENVIAHPSYEDCFDIYILKEIMLP